MSADFGLGKEALQGIVGGLGLIVVCVTIGSFVAQGMSHGPAAGHGDHAEAAAEGAQGGEAAAPAEAEAPKAE